MEVLAALLPSAWSEPLRCFLELPTANSLTRLLAARIACFVPIIVPFPCLVLELVTERVGGFPVGGRLVFRAAETARNLVEELRDFEQVLNKVFPLLPFPTMDLGVILAFICPSLQIPLVDGGEVAVGVDIEQGVPGFGTILADLPVLLILTLLFSLDVIGLEPTEVKLSHLSSDIRLPKCLPLSPFALCDLKLEAVFRLDDLKLKDSPLTRTSKSSSETDALEEDNLVP